MHRCPETMLVSQSQKKTDYVVVIVTPLAEQKCSVWKETLDKKDRSDSVIGSKIERKE